MPNTLAHIGVQGIASRAAAPRLGWHWALLGSTIPDIAWITHRLAKLSWPGIDLYDLRVWAVIQSSLLFSLFLAAAFAALSPRPRAVFLVLAANSLAHLLLDALQTKWGNGVVLAAPFTWRQVDWGLFWPEGWISVALTLLGVAAVAVAWRASGREGRALRAPRAVEPRGNSPGPGRIALALALLAFWGAGPALWLEAAERDDPCYAHTLRQRSERPGRPLALDRVRCEVEGRDVRLVTYAGERLRALGPVAIAGGRVSVRGVFVDRATVLVHQSHAHWPGARDAASYAGLAAILLCWLRLGARLRSRAGRGPETPTARGVPGVGES